MKAGMTKLTWARWTGWGWGDGRGESTQGTSEQVVALGRGWPSPAAKGTIDLARKSSSSSEPLFLSWGQGQVYASQGTAHPQPGHSEQHGRRVPAHPLWCRSPPGPVYLRSRDGKQFSPPAASGQALPAVGRASSALTSATPPEVPWKRGKLEMACRVTPGPCKPGSSLLPPGPSLHLWRKLGLCRQGGVG